MNYDYLSFYEYLHDKKFIFSMTPDGTFKQIVLFGCLAICQLIQIQSR